MKRQLYHARKVTCERLRKTAPHWEFLLHLVSRYGSGGMSSDDTDEDEPLYHVKGVPWRRKEATKFFEVIDSYRNKVTDKRGSRPRNRVRDTDASRESRRQPVKGLPISFYEGDWLKIDLFPQELIRKSASSENFHWMNIRSRNSDQNV